MISKATAIGMLRAAMLRARAGTLDGSGFAQGLMIGWKTAGMISEEEYRRLHVLLLNLIDYNGAPFPHDPLTF